MKALAKLLNSTFYNKEKLLLAFEYGAMLAEVAHQQNVELTPELMKRAEAMMESEFSEKTNEELATDMAANLLSVFELDLSK